MKLDEKGTGGLCSSGCDAEVIQRHWQSFSFIFQRADRYFIPPFHYLPVIPLLLTIPLSLYKLTQLL